MKQQRLAIILILTTIFVFAWIGFGFYHTIVSSTLEPEIAEKTRPIPPSFNAQAIDMIMKRRVVAPSYQMNGTSASQAATPTPEEEIVIPTNEPFDVASEEAEAL